MRVLIFGDSITQGFWDTEGGWVARLRKHYDEAQVKNTLVNDEPTVFNLGVSGDMTRDVVARLESETKSRLWPGEDMSFVFSVGLNDTVYRGQEFESTPEKYLSELEDILKIASKYSNKILFIGLSPVVNERVQPLQWSTSGKCYSNARILEFENVLKDFCKTNKVIHAPIFESIREEQQIRELMPDGAHPNNEGHDLIYQLVRPELDKLLA